MDFRRADREKRTNRQDGIGGGEGIKFSNEIKVSQQTEFAIESFRILDLIRVLPSNSGITHTTRVFGKYSGVRSFVVFLDFPKLFSRKCRINYFHTRRPTCVFLVPLNVRCRENCFSRIDLLLCRSRFCRRHSYYFHRFRTLRYQVTRSFFVLSESWFYIKNCSSTISKFFFIYKYIEIDIVRNKRSQ